MPNISQQTKLSPDESRAFLGIATRLSENLMKQQNPQPEPTDTPETLETAPESTEVPELESPITEDILVEKLEEFKEEIKELLKSENAKESDPTK